MRGHHTAYDRSFIRGVEPGWKIIVQQDSGAGESGRVAMPGATLFGSRHEPKCARHCATGAELLVAIRIN
jgi:hypothetical protein